MPFVSFCISTYKRPQILLTQLQLLSRQTYTDFEVVVSDNDPEQSGKTIIKSLNDQRFKYYSNEINLGMIKSFNKSIERSNTPYIIMITDDDPLNVSFLEEMVPLINQYPDKSVYGGFIRKRGDVDKIEEIDSLHFPSEVLHPKKNPSIFWSNCILRKADVIKIGYIPDYGSPHLADHALLALTGSVNGGIIRNKIYSSHNLHENNYSKGNFDSYYNGCVGFYNLLSQYFKERGEFIHIQHVIHLHLEQWFISMSFSLRKYFYKQKNRNKLQEIDNFSKQILTLNFMKRSRAKYQIKKIIFNIKVQLGLL
ncbi:glycosyltransferase family 2 protein [Panacibacter ginsenosidivorans]|uniref:Glycosyltransferase family 2 protein n=1 Tax=Panacibacter ginsenosidivorans TaxID=1813871 RepID=A0A5B8V4J7_9BACT|nr:glycosyltransferase family 2 protein [Panacibacter ginsenosidivorans]QEC65955.1 glycosyltransferase family 2 protein [Panacibacter ginsenosidivorans]